MKQLLVIDCCLSNLGSFQNAHHKVDGGEGNFLHKAKQQSIRTNLRHAY